MRKEVPKATGRPSSLETRIRELLGRPQYAPMDLPELARLLGVGRDQQRLLRETLAREILAMLPLHPRPIVRHVRAGIEGFAFLGIAGLAPIFLCR